MHQIHLHTGIDVLRIFNIDRYKVQNKNTNGSILHIYVAKSHPHKSKKAQTFTKT